MLMTGRSPLRLNREAPKAKGSDKGGRPRLIDGSRVIPSKSPPTLHSLGLTNREAPKAKGTADGTPGPGRGKNGVTTSNRVSPPTLHALGLTKRDSSQAQKLARLPEEKFQAVKCGSIVAILAAIIARCDRRATGRDRAGRGLA
jgi:hypothetical protein